MDLIKLATVTEIYPVDFLCHWYIYMIFISIILNLIKS